MYASNYDLHNIRNKKNSKEHENSRGAILHKSLQRRENLQMINDTTWFFKCVELRIFKVIYI